MANPLFGMSDAAALLQFLQAQQAVAQVRSFTSRKYSPSQTIRTMLILPILRCHHISDSGSQPLVR